MCPTDNSSIITKELIKEEQLQLQFNVPITYENHEHFLKAINY